MEPIFLHDHPDLPDLLSIVADKESIDPFLVEKDYWIMHVHWGLQSPSTPFSSLIEPPSSSPPWYEICHLHIGNMT